MIPIFAPVVECIDNREEFPISELEVQINSNLVSTNKAYQITGQLRTHSKSNDKFLKSKKWHY